MSNELNKATLERKDKDELTQIAVAMGGKPTSRARKADIIGLIMELAGVSPDAVDGDGGGEAGDEASAGGSNGSEARGYTADPMADARAEASGGGTRAKGRAKPAKDEPKEAEATDPGPEAEADKADEAKVDEAKAEPEGAAGDSTQDGGGDKGAGADQSEGGGRKRRRRGRGRGGSEEADEPQAEPVDVEGYLDLREDGYGFLRVNGALPSKEDVYVSVKQVRQYGLRKGDQIAGAGRPASRSEKNPALVRIDSVNGREPEQAVNRAEFAELTPLFPEEQLVLTGDDGQRTLRAIDVLAPIGLGTRGMIVAPPRTGKTTALMEIAAAIQASRPDVELLVVMIDERPEEVTEMSRFIENGDVVASTFESPAEEHCAVAELTLERAKRRVELEHDVVIILDGLTRLTRAYNTANGRVSGGLDMAAIHPAKRFFGAARKAEQGGSLTVLATIDTETGSDLDQAIFTEFEGTATMTLELDRRAAERDIFPAINVAGTTTRRVDRLVGDDLAAQVNGLHASIEAAADGDSLAALEALYALFDKHATNQDLLTKGAK